MIDATFTHCLRSLRSSRHELLLARRSHCRAASFAPKKNLESQQEMLRKLVCFLVASSVAALVPPSHSTPRRRSVVVKVEKREAASL